MNQISIQDYCKNPQLYKNSLSTNTLNYYNSQCQNTQNVNSNFENIKNDILENLKDVYDDALKPVLNKILPLIESMLSPSGLAVLAGFYGYNLTIKFLSNVFKDWFKTIATGNILKLTEYLGKNGIKIGGELFNEMIVGRSLFECIDVGLGRISFALIGVVSGVGSLLSIINPALEMFMLVGIVLDMWDPCNLNNQIGSEALRILSENFNKAFREEILKNIDSLTRSNNDIVIKNSFPLEYFDDNILASVLTDDEKKYFDDLKTKYMLEYLANLTVNSDGYPIKRDDNMPRIQESHLTHIEKYTSNLLGNKNTVAANWIYKFLPIIIIILILLLILIFFIIK